MTDHRCYFCHKKVLDEHDDILRGTIRGEGDKPTGVYVHELCNNAYNKNRENGESDEGSIHLIRTNVQKGVM